MILCLVRKNRLGSWLVNNCLVCSFSVFILVMMLAALLLQINNLFRGKGAKAVGYENQEKHLKIVAKQLNIFFFFFFFSWEGEIFIT